VYRIADILFLSRGLSVFLKGDKEKSIRRFTKLAEDKSQDIQERRSEKKRRQYEFALHIPERRRGKGRRREDNRKNPKDLDEGSNLLRKKPKKSKS